MTTTTSERVQKHRDALRAAGMRPIQIWVPDTRSEAFANACREQSLSVSATENNNPELNNFLHETLTDIEGWSA